MQVRRSVVGSKDFTESVILAEILAQALEKRGVTVTRQLELGGNLAHDGLLAHQIDVYPEYTGTAYTAILKHKPISDPQAVYDQTKAEYAEKFGLIVGPSARVFKRFCDTRARRRGAEEQFENDLGCRARLSQLAGRFRAGFYVAGGRLSRVFGLRV